MIIKLFKLYILFCLICPVFNIEKEQPIEEPIEEVEFWCDCGAAIRWYEVMLSDG
jgi:hypothetical protein